jgi:Leucine-rich repeat (LRR) protein
MLFFFFILFLIDQTSCCPLTDEYLSRCHCGILTNGESYIKCEENSLNEIPKFKRSFPYDELRLNNNNIKTLSSSSFDNIKTIRRINFQGNSLSYIDKNLFRLLGNYLEELILTGDNEINSLEFLTSYPLKKLRLLKLEKFNLHEINLQKLFINMTKLEIVHLNSCQLKQIPNLTHIQILNLENNSLSNRIFLSTFYHQLNLAHNQISSIILQNNPNLMSLNLSNNQLNDFYSLTISNQNLTTLDLSANQLTSIDWSILNENLIYLNLSSNHFNKIQLTSLPKSLSILDLSFNQLKTIDKNHFFQQLNYLNLQHNPLDCNCHLQWLQNHLTKFNICLSFDFKCQLMPRVTTFNITYTSENSLFIEWSIIDHYQTINYLQISIEQPYRISQKLDANQTRGLISEKIEFNKRYHICLILIHKYARDKYCRDFLTKTPILNQVKSNEIIFDKNPIETTTTTKGNDFNEKNFYLLLIGSCMGGVLTFVLLLTCCYLCYQIHHYKNSNQQPIYERCSQHFHYPVYHPHHQIIYNSENISNSTDSTHMDTSISTTNNPKHIYHTIDSQDYCSLNRQHQQLFHLWNESVKHNR